MQHIFNIHGSLPPVFWADHKPMGGHDPEADGYHMKYFPVRVIPDLIG